MIPLALSITQKAHDTISLAAQDFADGQCRKHVKRAKARIVKSGTVSESGIWNDERVGMSARGFDSLRPHKF